MSPARATPVSVVITDNDQAACQLMARKLGGLGFEAVCCPDVMDMFAELKHRPSAVLMMDERVDGLETAALIPKILKKAEEVGRRYVVLVTDQGPEDVAHERAFERAGALRLLHKPVLAGQLTSAMAEAVSVLAQAPDARGEAALTEARVEPLDRRTVLRLVPAESGVLSLDDAARHPLLVEWTDNLFDRLCRYLDLDPATSETARRARFFQFLATTDRDQEAKVFDRLVNRTGRFPILMTLAPSGARHQVPPEGEPASPADPKSVTGYKLTTDSKMEQKLRRLLAQEPTDQETLDWLAYTLYSNNLLDEAIGCYTKLFEGGSRRPEHYFYCGNARWKKGDRPAALVLWQQAQRLDPAGLIGRKARARAEQAEVGAPLVLTES